MHLIHIDNITIKRFIDSILLDRNDNKLVKSIIRNFYDNNYTELLESLILRYMIPVRHILSEDSNYSYEEAIRVMDYIETKISNPVFNQIYVADCLDILYLNTMHDTNYGRNYNFHPSIYDDIYSILIDEIPHEQAMDSVETVVSVFNSLNNYIRDYITEYITSIDHSGNLIIYAVNCKGRLFLFLFPK